MKNFKIMQYYYDPNMNVEFKEGQIVNGEELPKNVPDDFTYVNVFFGGRIIPMIKGVHVEPAGINVMGTGGIKPMVSVSKDGLSKEVIDTSRERDKPVSTAVIIDNSSTGVLKPSKARIKRTDFAKSDLKEQPYNYLIATVAGAGLGFATHKYAYKKGNMNVFLGVGALIGLVAYSAYRYKKALK